MSSFPACMQERNRKCTLMQVPMHVCAWDSSYVYVVDIIKPLYPREVAS